MIKTMILFDLDGTLTESSLVELREIHKLTQQHYPSLDIGGFTYASLNHWLECRIPYIKLENVWTNESQTPNGDYVVDSVSGEKKLDLIVNAYRQKGINCFVIDDQPQFYRTQTHQPFVFDDRKETLLQTYLRVLNFIYR